MTNESPPMWYWRFLPARLNPEQTAQRLGVKAHDIPVLVGRGLLRPLGHPNQSSVKHFATVVVERLANDPAWLGRATDAIYGRWIDKNVAKNKDGPGKKKPDRHPPSKPKKDEDKTSGDEAGA